MRHILLVFTCSAAAWGQSMSEAGALMTGSVVGSAAGKKVSDSVNKNVKKSAKILDAASKTGAPASKPATPMLQVGRGVPKAELNNVPPPPPPARRAVASRPAPRRTVSMPVVMSAVIPAGPPPEPVNVDLGGISSGMLRESVLALGHPSARITLSEDGHLVEIFQYRNQTLTSGTVRLRDGAVYSIEPRP